MDGSPTLSSRPGSRIAPTTRSGALQAMACACPPSPQRWRWRWPAQSPLGRLPRAGRRRAVSYTHLRAHETSAHL
eukprot:11454415-Alexandrium_andersonii.AAC.1